MERIRCERESAHGSNKLNFRELNEKQIVKISLLTAKERAIKRKKSRVSELDRMLQNQEQYLQMF